MSNLRQAAQQALEALEWNYNTDLDNIAACEQWAKMLEETITALRAALAEPEQEPVATKQMLRWVEHLKRLSDDGQHMSIPGLSSGACWELAIELAQFIKNTAPTPRKPLTDDEIVDIWAGVSMGYDDQINIIELGRAIERHHGIGEQHDQR